MKIYQLTNSLQVCYNTSMPQLQTKLSEAKINLNSLIAQYPKKEKKLINKALELAEEAHKEQTRYEGGPYILHPIRVAVALITKLKINNPELITAALLHDSVEDADLEIEQIKENFGPKAAATVAAVTRDKTGESTENKYEKKYKKFQKLMQESRQVRAIKACDWLDNLQSMPEVPPQNIGRSKFKRWQQEAETMYLPLAQSVDPQIAQEMLEALNYMRSTIKSRKAP